MLIFGLYRGSITAPIADWTPVNGPLIEALDKFDEKDAESQQSIEHPASVTTPKPEQTVAPTLTTAQQTIPSQSPTSAADFEPVSSVTTKLTPIPNASGANETPQTPNPAENGLIDLNRATQTELETLPGIGSSKAKAILEYRERQQGFSNADQLLEVKGIGPKILERIIPLVRISEWK